MAITFRNPALLRYSVFSIPWGLQFRVLIVGFIIFLKIVSPHSGLLKSYRSLTLHFVQGHK